jgi:hypothetical protein
MAVLAVSVAGVAIVTSMLLSAIDDARADIAGFSGTQARLAADTCAELGLLALHDDSAFVGTGTSTNQDATCTWEITDVDGHKEIRAEGASGTTIRRVLLTVSAENPPVITGYAEPESFAP